MKKMSRLVLGVVMFFPVVGLSSTTAIYSGPNQVEDLTMVTNGGDGGYYNAGSNKVLSAGYFSSLGGDSCTLIRFLNLNELAGQTITKATLSLTYAGPDSYTSDTTLNLYQVTSANADWIEGTNANYDWTTGASTWNSKHAYDTAWAGAAGCSQAGVDYVATALYTKTVSAGTPGCTSITFDIPVSVVQSWVDNYIDGQKNPGLLLNGSTNYQALFYSSELGLDSFGPVLTLEYVPEPVTMSLLVVGILGFLGRRK
jgi:hypothetical protein